VDEWFAEYRERPSRELRNRLVEAHLHLVDHHVARFSRSSGVSRDDLRQTAFMSLMNAVERFDPERGFAFATFASRTIDGGLKRHLRDRTWAVRPPRRTQELSLRLRSTGEELTHRLGRAPTVAELAAEVDCDTEDVLEALEAGRARAAVGLEAPASTGASSPAPVDLLAAVDPGFASVDAADELAAALAGLGSRAQLVLRLRYVDDLSQPEIADQIGVSQSYVSRMLRSSLDRLREAMASQ
jgi:RNA polymerase sigma-B factor